MEAPVHVGQIVAGKYEVQRILARGGYGVVVKAKHLQLLEPCAIKFMLPHMLATPMARERFLREARACARLKSDHVVRVFDVGELDAETPYMVLEYLDGVDLDAYLTPRRPLPVREAAAYVRQICSALSEAHALGIVHRDLKPANVFLARLADGTRRVKLLDFGISKLLGDAGATDQAQTLDGAILGTPFFMAPEQANGLPVDARTDIWAVGVILYLLLTAQLPFAGETPFKTLAHIRMQDPTPPSRHVSSIPPALDATILRCLEKDPARRPQEVHVLAAALAPFADAGGDTLSVPASRAAESAPMSLSAPLPTSELAPHRRWRKPALIAAGALAVAASASLALRASGPSPPRDLETRVVASSVELLADAGGLGGAPIVSAGLGVSPVVTAASGVPPIVTAASGGSPMGIDASSAETAYAPQAPPPAPPPSASARRPASFPRAPGFDLRNRR